MKGKERENSAFVYLSVLKERGAEGTGGGEKGWGGAAAAAAEVAASVVFFCPMALDLFVSGGKRNKKGETESERGRAINITQAAERRAKEALKGVGTQTERGRHGGIFMGEKRQQVCMLLQSLDAFCSCASKEGESGGERRKGDRKNEKPWRFAAVCDSDEVTSSYHETYFCRGEEERREEIHYIIRKAEGKLRQLKQHSRHLGNADWFLDTDMREVSRKS